MGRPDQTKCPDCDASITDAATVHCPRCGQKLAVGPLRLGEIVSEFVGTLVSLEFPILRTTRDLCRGPGGVAAAWIGGRRRSYLSPIKFLVIVGVVAALAYEPLLELRRLVRGANEPIYSTGLAHYAPQYAAFLCIGLLLPIAGLLGALSRVFALPRSWLEWYALGLFAYGFGILVQLLMQLVSVPFALAGSFRMAEVSVPVVVFTWGAAGFVPAGMRVRASALALGAQVVTVAAIAGAFELVN